MAIHCSAKSGKTPAFHASWLPSCRRQWPRAHAEDWGYDFTYDDMVDALFEQGIDISNMTVWRHMRDELWNTRCRNRTVPMLTEKTFFSK